MDPDDMYLNPDLFQEIYNYNLKYNLDIIEFSVFQQIEGQKKIILPNNHYEKHYHNFGKKIISQPELSNLLYYYPGTKNYSKTICRNISPYKKHRSQCFCLSKCSYWCVW